MNNQEIMNALEELHNPNVYNQSLVDCKSMLNLSKETLEEHLLSWLWSSDGVINNTACDQAYALQIGRIEEFLVMNNLIYGSEA